MTQRRFPCLGPLLLAGVALLACFKGCSKRDQLEPPRYPVSGTVTVDGNDLPEGVISFRTPSLGLIERIPIKEGAFAGTATAGERRIEFSVIKDVKHPGPMMPGIETPESLRVETLPPKFNTTSTFTAQVTPEGPNEFSFELQSK
jgi:hypothetical protein